MDLEIITNKGEGMFPMTQSSQVSAELLSSGTYGLHELLLTSVKKLTTTGLFQWRNELRVPVNLFVYKFRIVYKTEDNPFNPSNSEAILPIILFSQGNKF